MSDDIEWGPWIEHDGKGCPLSLGTFCRVTNAEGSVIEGRVCRYDFSDFNAWNWAHCGNHWAHKRVMRYSIRKPRALTLLQEIARDVSAPVEKVREGQP